MRAYVVRQGDYLSKLAHRFGFDATAVWHHDANTALRNRRRNPEILHPGDILQIPTYSQDVSIIPGQTHRIRAAVPMVPVQVRFRTPEGEPLANKEFVVRGAYPGGTDATDITGTSDGDGVVSFEVPVSISEVTIEFVEFGFSFRTLVGHMDPITEPSGVWKRLRHLGYLKGRHLGPEGAFGGALTRAIADFQRSAGLEETGQIDEATRDALVDHHGS